MNYDDDAKGMTASIKTNSNKVYIVIVTKHVLIDNSNDHGNDNNCIGCSDAEG
jgi:hypothetical protein